MFKPWIINYPVSWWAWNWLLTNLSFSYEWELDVTDSHNSNDWTDYWTTDSAWLIGRCRRWDWANDYITVPDWTDLEFWVWWSDFSFSWAMYPDTAPNSWTKNRAIMGQTPWWWNDAFYVNWRYISSSVNVLRVAWSSIWSDFELLDHTIVIPTTGWTMMWISVDMSTSTMYVYKNWVLSWSVSWTFTSLHNSSWLFNLFSANSWTLNFDWKLDLIRWYKGRLLTADDHLALYNSWAWLAYADLTT